MMNRRDFMKLSAASAVTMGAVAGMAPASFAENAGVHISRRPPQQKYTSFEEYMDAHGGATAPIEDHSEEV